MNANDIVDTLLHNYSTTFYTDMSRLPHKFRDYYGNSGCSQDFFDAVDEHLPDQSWKKNIILEVVGKCSRMDLEIKSAGASALVKYGWDDDPTMQSYAAFLSKKEPVPEDLIRSVGVCYRLYANKMFKQMTR